MGKLLSQVGSGFASSEAAAALDKLFAAHRCGPPTPLQSRTR